MFKINGNNGNEIMIDGNDNFRYFKPDLDLKTLRLNLEANEETRLFYEINENN